MSLVDYSDSGSDGAESQIQAISKDEENCAVRAVRAPKDVLTAASSISKDNKECIKSEKPKPRLPPPPLPGGTSNKAEKVAESDQYGRIRSFPHVDGNYAGYIFIKAGHAEGLEAAAQQIVLAARKILPTDRVLHSVSMDEAHVSLSRTFAVRRHHIEPLVAQLAERLRAVPRFVAALGGGRLYANDEGTRTFAGIRVCSGQERVRRLIAAADAALRSFRQAPYYSEADVHVSVAWSVGPLPDSAPQCPSDLEAVLPVTCVHAKIGARTYSFELQ